MLHPEPEKRAERPEKIDGFSMNGPAGGRRVP